MRYGDHIHGRQPGVLRAAWARFGPWFERLLDPRIVGLEHLAAPGPAVVVGNHSGGPLAMFEPLLFAYAARSLGPHRLPTLLLHDVMWRTPFAPWLEKVGAVRASVASSDALLEAGKKVLVYPGGDREVFRRFWHRDRIQLGDRRGYVKLAVRHGVPLTPVVTAGNQSGFVTLTDGSWLARRFPLARKLRIGVLPISLSFPFGLSVGIPAPYIPLTSQVRMSVLPPIHFPRSGEDAANDASYVEACHEHVRTTMQAALHELADERRRERRATRSRWGQALSRAFERWTLAARAPLTIAPLPRAARIQLSETRAWARRVAARTTRGATKVS